MEWEEALLKARGGDMPREPATRYYRQAARTRHVAEGATTHAVKARLRDDAVHYYELAANADQVAEEIAASTPGR
jgi:hypothetical protein